MGGTPNANSFYNSGFAPFADQPLFDRILPVLCALGEKSLSRSSSPRTPKQIAKNAKKTQAMKNCLVLGKRPYHFFSLVVVARESGRGS